MTDEEGPDSTPFVRDALRRYPLTVLETRRVAESFNTVYRIRAVEGDFALRVGPSRGIHRVNAIVAEAAWTTQLRRAGVAAPRVARTVDGAAGVTDAEGSGRRAAVLTWVTGTAMPEPASDAQIAALGELSAHLHSATPPSDTLPDGVLDAREPLAFAVPDVLATMPARFRGLFVDRAALAREQLAKIWNSTEEIPRTIHFDLTPRNVVTDQTGTLLPIDFEDLAWGHRVQDIAHSLYGIGRGELSNRIVDAFRSGYERRLPWPEASERVFGQLFAARRLGMVNLAVFLGRPGLAAYLERHAAALRGSTES